MTKSELRFLFAGKRSVLSAAERQTGGERIAVRLISRIAWSRLDNLSVFISLNDKNEVPTDIFISRIRQNFPHLKIYAPRINFADGTLENALLEEGAPLVVNKWRISEPSSAETIAPEHLSAVITPLLAFDRRGFRVGYGGGFYDRLFAECRSDTLKIGVSFFPPVEKISDCDAFDVPLDFCFTPDETFVFSR